MKKSNFNLFKSLHILYLIVDMLYCICMLWFHIASTANIMVWFGLVHCDEFLDGKVRDKIKSQVFFCHHFNFKNILPPSDDDARL